MLGAISPLTLGAAATALSSVADAIPTPGDFAAALRRASGGDDADASQSSTEKTATPATRTEFRQLVHGIERSLGKLPGIHDIDSSRPIRLKLDADGHVRAEGDHPDAAKINAMLAADDDLSAAIEQVLRSINAATSPELLADMSTGGASVGEPTLTYLDGRLTPSLA
ncbi:MAG: hypothetical protein WD875_08200 [Pirellulales bacterium]